MRCILYCTCLFTCCLPGIVQLEPNSVRSLWSSPVIKAGAKGKRVFKSWVRFRVGYYRTPIREHAILNISKLNQQEPNWSLCWANITTHANIKVATLQSLCGGIKCTEHFYDVSRKAFLCSKTELFWRIKTWMNVGTKACFILHSSTRPLEKNITKRRTSLVEKSVLKMQFKLCPFPWKWSWP